MKPSSSKSGNSEDFLDSLNLKMKALRSLETPATVCQSTWCNISEDLNLSFKIGYKNIKNYDRNGHNVKSEVYVAIQTHVVVA